MKMFVITKYLLAKNIPDALKKEKTVAPDDVFVDGDWKRCFIDKRLIQPTAPMGFTAEDKPKRKKK